MLLSTLLSTLAPILAILTPLFTFVGFGIKAFTGRPADDIIHEAIHRIQSQPSSQPGIAPAQNSPSVAVPRPPLSARWSLHGLIPHPRLLGAFLLGQLLVFVPPFILGQSNDTLLSFLGVIGLLVCIAACISGAVIAVRERRWVWFIVILVGIVIAGYPVLFFSIFARPEKQGTQSS